MSERDNRERDLKFPALSAANHERWKKQSAVCPDCDGFGWRVESRKRRGGRVVERVLSRERCRTCWGKGRVQNRKGVSR